MRLEPSPEPRETTSRFEKLLAALVTNRVDFAVVGGLAVIFNGYPRLTLDADVLVDDRPDNLLLKQDSWRDKDNLDVQAMREILAREGCR